jgi:hypothetical protein
MFSIEGKQLAEGMLRPLGIGLLGPLNIKQDADVDFGCPRPMLDTSPSTLVPMKTPEYSRAHLPGIVPVYPRIDQEYG